ncbi:hypothetical protein RUND412_010814, partial [Rhizina undulata]
MASEGFNRAVISQQTTPATPADELALNNGRITGMTDTDISADIENSADATDDAPSTITPPGARVIA